MSWQVCYRVRAQHQYHEDVMHCFAVVEERTVREHVLPGADRLESGLFDMISIDIPK
ncbi:hypothetical protein E4U45_000257 [Claviceps purpurea]|nr:hypothetical protein E4U45_000257 [Claviceps purpurea]